MNRRTEGLMDRPTDGQTDGLTKRGVELRSMRLKNFLHHIFLAKKDFFHKHFFIKNIKLYILDVNCFELSFIIF